MVEMVEAREVGVGAGAAGDLAPTYHGGKVQHILRAAGELFRGHGFAATSMDAVAREADVSKATLYAYYASKQLLFEAVIKVEDDRLSAALLQRTAQPGEFGRPGTPVRPAAIRKALLSVAHSVLDLLLAPETVGSYRMVMAEAARSPDLGRSYYENGAGQLLSRLEQFIGGAMADGRLRKGHPRRAAEQFIGLVRGDLQLRALLGIGAAPTPRQRTAVLTAGIDTFLRAYGAESP